MNRNEVIKYPILSEKTYAQMENNVFTFAVDFRTNKIEVKKTVEFIFGVKVKKVNIATVAKKPTKLGRFAGFTNRYKKAVITLSEGTINLFPEESPTPKESTKPIKEESTGPSEAEKKAAAKIAAKAKEAEAKASASKSVAKPATAKPATAKPAAKKPVAKPATAKPAAKKPVAKPATAKPAAKK